jgi:dephospho-CoA kinase
LLVLGVTGNIACGKSTVDELLADIAGATVIDADRVTHALLRDDVGVRSAIVSAFGPTVMESDGSLNRSRLGRIVFSDRAQLRRLEAIVHPGVRHLVRTELAAMPPDATVVIDAVKLLDGDLGTLVDSVWWVTAPPEQQLERLIRSRGLSEAEARSRLAAQPLLELYRSRVHVIIDNSGSLAQTRRQVAEEFGAVLAGRNMSRTPQLGSEDEGH